MVAFNIGIGKQAIASLAGDILRLFPCHFGQRELHVLPHAHSGDPFDTQTAQRPIHGQPLRIQDAVLGRDIDLGPQASFYTD